MKHKGSGAPIHPTNFQEARRWRGERHEQLASARVDKTPAGTSGRYGGIKGNRGLGRLTQEIKDGTTGHMRRLRGSRWRSEDGPGCLMWHRFRIPGNFESRSRAIGRRPCAGEPSRRRGERHSFHFYEISGGLLIRVAQGNLRLVARASDISTSSTSG